jgi:hypothetical protein
MSTTLFNISLILIDYFPPDKRLVLNKEKPAIVA